MNCFHLFSIVYCVFPKKGNAKECSDYGTIALISHASKVMLKILQARLQQYMNRELPDVQTGFRKGRGTRGQIANFCWIIKKAREFQKTVYFCFIDYAKALDYVSSVQLLSCVWLFATPWSAARQAPLSITNSRSSPRPTFIKSVMPSSHLILCRPLLLLPSIFPSIRVFSNESALHIRWPKHWSFSFNISPSNEHPELISFRMNWLHLLAVQGTLKSRLQHHSLKASILWHSAFFIVHLSHPYMTTGKTIALTVSITTTNKLWWKILKEMGIPDHLTCLMRYLYTDQEATVSTGHGTTDWLQIRKGVHEGCILSPCLFNLYAEYIMQLLGWMKHKLQSRLLGEISITSDMQMTPPLWQKVKRN